MTNWESLIAGRMRPAETVSAVTYKQAIRKAKDRRYYQAHKDDPEFKRKRSERMKRVRNTDEYRKKHRLEMRRRRAEKKTGENRMSFDIKQINKRETVKLWAILNGKYDDFVRAYSSEDSNLRRYWETMIEPEVQRECGEFWGENPRLPLHPIGYALMERNGLLPNQQQKK